MVDRVQLLEQIAAVDEHAVLRADALVHPLRRVGAGPDRIAPREPRLVLAREARDAARPEQQAGEVAQRLARHRQAVDDGAAEAHVGILGVAMLAGGNEQLATGIAESDFSHHPGDAGLHRREFAGQQEGLNHVGNVNETVPLRAIGEGSGALRPVPKLVILGLRCTSWSRPTTGSRSKGTAVRSAWSSRWFAGSRRSATA